MNKEKYGKYTYWIRLVDDVERAINNTIAQSTKMSPMDLWDEATKGGNESDQVKEKIIDKLEDIASKRYYSRTYLEGSLNPGDHVLMSLAYTAPDFQTRQKTKEGSYKSYLPQWYTTQVYVVERPWGTNEYRIGLLS